MNDLGILGNTIHKSVLRKFLYEEYAYRMAGIIY